MCKIYTLSADLPSILYDEAGNSNIVEVWYLGAGLEAEGVFPESGINTALTDEKIGISRVFGTKNAAVWVLYTFFLFTTKTLKIMDHLPISCS